MSKPDPRIKLAKWNNLLGPVSHEEVPTQRGWLRAEATNGLGGMTIEPADVYRIVGEGSDESELYSYDRALELVLEGLETIATFKGEPDA